MNNQMDPNNGVNSTGTLDGEGVAPGRLGVLDPAPAGRYPVTDQQPHVRWSKRDVASLMFLLFLLILSLIIVLSFSFILVLSFVI